MENLSILSVVLGTLTPMIIGFLYYSKWLFGPAWMDSIGKTEEDLQGANMAVIMGLALVMSFLITFFFINFNNSPGQEGEFDTFGHGAFHGIVIFVVMAMPIMVTNSLFERKSAKNILINLGYWLVTFVILGGLVDALNHWPNEA